VLPAIPRLKGFPRLAFSLVLMVGTIVDCEVKAYQNWLRWLSEVESLRVLDIDDADVDIGDIVGTIADNRALPEFSLRVGGLRDAVGVVRGLLWNSWCWASQL
jgi:hypothetical protein